MVCLYCKDHHEGPHSLQEMQDKLAQGQISRESYLWTEGMSDWKVMSEIPTFKPFLTLPPAPPPLPPPPQEVAPIENEPLSMTPILETTPANNEAPLSPEPEPEPELTQVLPQLSQIKMETEPSIEKTSQTSQPFEDQQPAQEVTPQAPSPKRTSFRRLFIWVIITLIVGGTSLAYIQGGFAHRGDWCRQEIPEDW